MLDIKGNDIFLSRGNTLRLDVSVVKDDEPYTPAAGDVITFCVKHNYESTSPVIMKEVPNDSMILLLTPDDTKQLPFGRYVYDFKMSFANGDVDTFIRGNFVLTEVTH